MEELFDEGAKGLEFGSSTETCHNEHTDEMSDLQATMTAIEGAVGWVLKCYRPTSNVALYQARNLLSSVAFSYVETGLYYVENM